MIGTGASAVQVVPEIAQEAEQAGRLPAHGQLVPAAQEPAVPARGQAGIEHVPGVQAFRRRFIFHYGESLTAMIRHPKTVGQDRPLRVGRVHALQLRDPEVRAQGLAGLHLRLQARAVQLGLPARAAAAERRARHRRDPGHGRDGVVTADGTRHEVDCVIWGTGFRTNDFMFPMEITGAGGRTLREGWGDGAARAPRDDRPGLPVDVRHVRPEHEHLGRVDHRLPRGAGRVHPPGAPARRGRGAAAIEVRPEVEAASDRETQARFEGTAWTQCDSWYRDDDGRIVANWPGYMREYVERTRALDPAEFSFVPAPEREPDRLSPAA